jgi:hypothetical protein
MFGFGTTEIIISLVILLVLLGPVFLTLFLKKRFPNRKNLGIFLSLLFAPVGQLYLEGATLYFIVLFVFYLLMNGTFQQPLVVWIANSILSALVMLYRFAKLEPPNTLKINKSS